MPARHQFVAAFGAQTAQPPAGLSSPTAADARHEQAQDEAKVQKYLECVFEDMQGKSEVKLLGKGCGFGYVVGPYCSYAERDGVHVLFSGEVSSWPGIDTVETNHDAFMSNVAPAEVDDAHWLLDFYTTFSKSEVHDNEAILQEALECLAEVRGSFAFVVYDSVSHRVLAARDSDGVQPLYWGSTDDGRLLFGSFDADLSVCEPTATQFPAGSLFASARHTIASFPGPQGWVIEGDDCPGELLSFMRADERHWRSVHAIPRITSKGCVTGAVYRVSSKPDMEHLARA
mmetsp:Transcript_6200/g.19167  ORF Transcript_6200/g.19167 Transcript_6200/m.19167 type:complete len:287 (-) Transcript_6200:868-1728(-)